MLRFIKDWTLPIAMMTGVVGYKYLTCLSFLTTPLIFCMLLLTFCKLSPRKIRFSPLHAWMVGIQLAGCLLAYLALAGYDQNVADSALICFLAPTATSAAVVTGMLGGSVASITTYTLISNLTVALFGPFIFSLVGPHAELSFWASFSHICLKVLPLLILPLLLAWSIQQYAPAIHRKLTSIHRLSFYLWAVALTIVTARTVSFLMNQENPDVGKELLIAAISLVICVAQFLMGRAVGRRYKKAIAGGQSLGQKNTILAIWMAQSFLNPVSSLGPAAYVLWQNSINSWQLYKRRKKITAERQG
ncbi:MAG: transporter [Bacteroidota bacterium]|nr:transporter [Bacteroidota bacterium]